MNNLKNYLLYLFLIENVAVQTSLLGGYTAFFFYLFLTLGAFFVLTGEFFKEGKVGTFWPFFVLSILYIIYEFSIGFHTINSQTLLYLVAKITTYAIIITCVDFNFQFYEDKILNGLSLLMCAVILYGMVTGGVNGDGSERLMLGFTNANTTSAMGAFILGFAIFTEKPWNLKNILIALIGLYAILAGGSRAGILLVFIILIMKYGISFKILGIMILLTITSIYILPSIGLETAGVDRLFDTFTGKEGTNRDAEREACMVMIAERPYSGWGFEAQNQGAAAEISKLPPHNGYLETLKFMGIPMGGLWIFVFLFSIVRVFWLYKKYNVGTDIYLAMLIAFAVNAWYESLIVGVHEFATNILFVCLAMTYKKISLVRNNQYIYDYNY